jgi:hypothetical protein
MTQPTHSKLTTHDTVHRTPKVALRLQSGWLDHDGRVGIACANRTLLVPRLIRVGLRVRVRIKVRKVREV